MINHTKRINRELKYEGKIIKFYKDTIKLNDGSITEWDFISHVGAAAVLPVLDDGRILLVKQYRNALDRLTLEIPAGGLESMEEPMIECAARELEEETGYHSNNLEFLISVRPTVAYCNERIDVFIAKDLVRTKQNLDEEECIEVQAYTVDELCKLIYDGIIQDSKTLSAILAYKDKYCNLRL